MEKNVNTFPDEILLNILGWLSPDDLLRATHVCKRWRTLPATKQGTTAFVLDIDEFSSRPVEPMCILHKLWELVYPGAITRYNGYSLPPKHLAKMTRLVTYRCISLITKGGELVLPNSVQTFGIRYKYAYPPPQARPRLIIKGGKHLTRFESRNTNTPLFCCDTVTHAILANANDAHEPDFGGFPNAEHVIVVSNASVKQHCLVGLSKVKTILIIGAGFSNAEALFERLPTLEKLEIQLNPKNNLKRVVIRRLKNDGIKLAEIDGHFY